MLEAPETDDGSFAPAGRLVRRRPGPGAAPGGGLRRGRCGRPAGRRLGAAEEEPAELTVSAAPVTPLRHRSCRVPAMDRPSDGIRFEGVPALPPGFDPNVHGSAGSGHGDRRAAPRGRPAGRERAGAGTGPVRPGGRRAGSRRRGGRGLRRGQLPVPRWIATTRRCGPGRASRPAAARHRPRIGPGARSRPLGSAPATCAGALEAYRQCEKRAPARGQGRDPFAPGLAVQGDRQHRRREPLLRPQPRRRAAADPDLRHHRRHGRWSR